jgi:hypothetical protein
MGGYGCACGGSQQRQDTCYLTATPSAAGRLLPPLHQVTSLLLKLYHECVNYGGWGRELYDAHGRMEKLTISARSLQPAPTVAASSQPCKPGNPASERRWTRDSVGGGSLWLRGGLITHSPRPYTSSTAEDRIAAKLATAGLAAPPAVISPLPSAQSASPPQAALPVLALLPQLAPPLQKIYKQ